MPVLRVDDRRSGFPSAPHLRVDQGHDLFAAFHIEAALGVREVVLDVDYEEGIAPLVAG
jgi:hypothetical protein